jgi:hypothetical protein
MTQATVPAPALVLFFGFLLSLEVWLGESFHCGEKPHFAHFAAEGDRLYLLNWPYIH